MFIPVKHNANWDLFCQKKQVQTNKHNTRENIKRVDHNYKVGDNVMLNGKDEYKYETSYVLPFYIMKFWKNGTVNLTIGAAEIR